MRPLPVEHLSDTGVWGVPMRRMRTIVAVTVLGALGPAGLAIAHEMPGRACDGPAAEKNKHCAEHVHGPDSDADGDHVVAKHDNCDGVYNPNQVNNDEDQYGDVCDHVLDGDGDGACDIPAEECAGLASEDDADGDGMPNELEDSLTPPS